MGEQSSQRKNGSPMQRFLFTPPPDYKIRNPFDRVLVKKLHQPICSPGMCKIYEQHTSSNFKWDIDEASILKPADIVVCNSQYEPSPDPSLEREAHDATERFFSQDVIVPSPFDQPVKKFSIPFAVSDTPTTQIGNCKESLKRDASCQTVLTLPSVLPQELEEALRPFFTYTKDQDSWSDPDSSANASLRRKLFFEGHSDEDEEGEEVETHTSGSSMSFQACSPMFFSPLSKDALSKGMPRSFGTPLQNPHRGLLKYRNKIFDGVEQTEPCFSPILAHTPQKRAEHNATDTPLRNEDPLQNRCGHMTTPQKRNPQTSASKSSPLVMDVFSPIPKCFSSDEEEKRHLTSPESEEMASCLDCEKVSGQCKGVGRYCRRTPDRSLYRRSSRLARSANNLSVQTLSDDSPSGRNMSGHRIKSSVSLNRSKSVQKLDFELDMSVDSSIHTDMFLRSNSVLGGSDTTASPGQHDNDYWHIEMTQIQQAASTNCIESSVHTNAATSSLHSDERTESPDIIDATPVKSKSYLSIPSYVTEKMRRNETAKCYSPMQISLDTSTDSTNLENTQYLENKKIDFSTIDLNLLTNQYQETSSKDMTNKSSFKRSDSGFNENSTLNSKSSYYESAIKQSELLVDCTNTDKSNSNVNWMRMDSGFKDETSSDSCQFYVDAPKDKAAQAYSREHDKENIFVNNFDKFSIPATSAQESMSISDVFGEDMVFHCNYSSTPSKNKAFRL